MSFRSHPKDSKDLKVEDLGLGFGVRDLLRITCGAREPWTLSLRPQAPTPASKALNNESSFHTHK